MQEPTKMRRVTVTNVKSHQLASYTHIFTKKINIGNNNRAIGECDWLPTISSWVFKLLQKFDNNIIFHILQP